MLFKNRPFPWVSRGFLERRIPGKNGEGSTRAVGFGEYMSILYHEFPDFNITLSQGSPLGKGLRKPLPGQGVENGGVCFEDIPLLDSMEEGKTKAMLRLQKKIRRKQGPRD